MNHNENLNLKILITDFIERIETEITFFKEHISCDLEYISQFDRYIKNNEDIFEKNLNKQEEFFRYAYENYHSYFPYIVNNSLLITFDSYFDYNFFLITELIAKKISPDWKFNKENGTYIYKCIEFYKTTLNINDDQPDWIVINEYHDIRNSIVHDNSCLIEIQTEYKSSKNTKKIKEHKGYKLIKKRKYIDLNEITGKFYITDNKFLIEYLECVESFFKFILNKTLSSFEA